MKWDKKDEEEDRVPSSTAAGLRPWSDLTGLVLFSIFRRLLSTVDALAFAATCRSWRAFSIQEFSTSTSSTSRPPLLLLPLLSPANGRSRTHQWLQPSRCSLLSLFAGDRSSYRCMASPIAFAGFCLGYFHGFWLSLPADDPQQPLLVDVFTGDEIRPPPLPIKATEVYYGALTAPLVSPSCFLLIFTSHKSGLLSWRPGGSCWSCHRIPVFCHALLSIDQVRAFEGKVYALDHCARLFSIKFEPQLALTPVRDMSCPFPPSLLFKYFRRQLVGCCGELLLVMIDDVRQLLPERIHVYRMDFTRLQWMKVESLGDCSLFLDLRGKSPVVCAEPGRWGGRSNCIYLVESGCDIVSIFPLDGSPISMIGASPLSHPEFCLPICPLPIWVVPSLFRTSRCDFDSIS